MHMPTVPAVTVVLALACASSPGCLTVGAGGMSSATGEPLSAPSPGHFRQGRAPVDEEDFYAIAGDDLAVRAVQAHRRSLIATQVGGQFIGYAAIAGLLLGAGALAGGVVLVTEQGPIGLALLVPGTLVMAGSFIAIPLGFVFAANAAAQMSRPVLPHGRALDAADRYNHRAQRPRRRRR